MAGGCRMNKSIMFMLVFFAATTAFGAAWPQKYNNGRHTLFTTAPAITTPGVFWVMDDIPTSSEGSTCTVIGNNNDIYCVRYDGTSYSIVELDRKGQVQRTYLSSSSVAVNSLAVSTTNLYASFDDGTFQAWVLGNTDINWSKTDDNIVSMVLLDDSGNVYFNSDTTVYSYEADGTDRWSYDISATSAGYWPAYYGGAVFVTYDNKMIALNTSNGSKRWLKDMSTWSSDWQYFTWPMIGPDGTIWTGRVSDDTVQDYVAISPSSGATNLGTGLPSSNSRLYSITNAKMLVFTGDGYLVGGTYDMSDLTVT